MKIGFFDSGIGGLTVLNETIKLLPNEDYIYYADTLNVPYGTKSKEEVKKYVFQAIEFLINQDVQAIVIACNTATSIAITDLRQKYNIPIIGMEPAVKPAIENKLNKRVLVTATELTLKEEKLKNLIIKLDSDNAVDLLPLPGLVAFAERFEFNKAIVVEYLKLQLSKYDIALYESIVLGCTHFTFFKDSFRDIFNQDVNIIDGNKGTANNLKNILEEKNILNQGSGMITYFNSGKIVVDNDIINKYNMLFKRLNQFKN